MSNASALDRCRIALTGCGVFLLGLSIFTVLVVNVMGWLYPSD